MRDPPGSRARCLSSVQCVRTSQSRGAPLGASELAVRSSALVWELSRQLLFRAHRQYLRLRFGPLETASGSGDRVVAKQRPSLMSPSVSLVCALLLRARVNMVTAERLAKNPLGVVQNIRNLTDLSLVSSQIPCILCPTAVSRLKIRLVQSLQVVASQTVGSRRSGTEPPRDELARAGRSLGPAWPSATQSSRLSRSSPTLARRRPLVGGGIRPPSTSSRQRSR